MADKLILYDSLTGNVKRFVEKLPNKFVCRHINNYDGISYYILITYTTGFGQVSKSTEDFLNKFSEKMLGIASSGNKNWGQNFAKSAEIISKKYNVPIIHKFELSGTDEDIKKFLKGVENIE